MAIPYLNRVITFALYCFHSLAQNFFEGPSFKCIGRFDLLEQGAVAFQDVMKLQFSPFLMEPQSAKTFRVPFSLSNDAMEFYYCTTYTGDSVSVFFHKDTVTFRNVNSNAVHVCDYRTKNGVDIFKTILSTIQRPMIKFGDLESDDLHLMTYAIKGFRDSSYPKRNDVERLVIAFASLYGGVEATGKWYMYKDPSTHSYYQNMTPAVAKEFQKNEWPEKAKVFHLCFSSLELVNEFIKNFVQIQTLILSKADYLDVTLMGTVSARSTFQNNNIFSIKQWPKRSRKTGDLLQLLDQIECFTQIPIIVKPNGFSPYGPKKSCLEIVMDCIANVDPDFVVETNFKLFDFLPNDLIHHLYPNSMFHAYGPDWLAYLKSGPGGIIMLKVPYSPLTAVSRVRHLMLSARIQSNIVWTRNIIHAPCDDVELADNYDFVIKNGYITAVL